jgi:hypothetical protein
MGERNRDCGTTIFYLSKDKKKKKKKRKGR